MPRRRQVSASTWREFERLVARIEETAAGGSAIVKSPGRVLDRITGRLREVDASVRTRVGSVDVLITIECRKRAPKQDVTWIEQLQTKKAAIGAARTIAVSPVGFSDGAMQAAAAYGIEARRLSEVTDQDVRNWLLPESLVHIFRKGTLLSFGLEMPRGTEPGVQLVSEDIDSVEREQAEARIFISLADGSNLSVNDIWLIRRTISILKLRYPITQFCNY